MDAEILRIIDWSPDKTLTQLHDQMIAMLMTCFSDNGTSPAMWLVVAPSGSEAAVVVTPWRNDREKRAAIRIMHDTLMDGPGGGICPMYSFSCEASMRVRSLVDDDGDEQVEDITFITSYDRHGHGLFTRFGVANAHPHGFGKLLARDDWDLSKPGNEDRLEGLLMNIYQPAAEREEMTQLRCAYCHQQARWDNAVAEERPGPRDGDAMLCMGCGEVGVFDSKAPYGSRKASKAELKEFHGDLRLRLGSALIKAMQQK